MDSKTFFDRVKEMRYYQKEYFRTRSRTALQQSKALEREIDNEIKRVNRHLNIPDYTPPQQPNLFSK